MVYRANDLLLQRDVALKLLPQAELDAEARDRLLHEARSAAQLNHPNIVSVFDAGEAENRQFIVMELVEGPSLLEHRPDSFSEIISIARQVCAALEHAHAHGVIHRDLKPGNILISPDGTAKLTDFGLARSPASHITVEGDIVGTVFYLPPEQAMGKPVDARTDLYALGVVLYELVAGRLPFIADQALAVISQHLFAPLVPPSTYRPDLPPAFEKIILKLLAKNPQERFASASEVIVKLDEVETLAGMPEQLPVEKAQPAEAVLLLEKLVRGRLVGRQPELAQLKDLWKHVRQGHALLVLLSGEPGVGKTRLAHELLVYARLNGAPALQGGCYEYEATSPYLPVSEALREWVGEQNPLALQAQIGPLAPELARLAPEIEDKIGSLAPNPKLPPNEERLRLFDHVARLLQNLASQRGLLLFIDDLHWADQGTLALLHYLMRNLRNVPVMILAAYREIELDRNHPLSDALVEWNRERLAMRLPLGRLSSADVAELLASLFGMESASAEFVDVIYRETEGNPFFVEEVVKALIQQGQIYRVDGRWDRQALHDLTIPQSIKEAISRRLNRLTPPCIETLHVASVMGKRFDFDELSAASTQGEDELLDALDEAVAAQLLRVEGETSFVFTHDKIREVLFEELNPIRRRRLHQRAGAGLEKLYRESPVRSSCCTPVQVLAYHFIEAGDLEKGLGYSIQAAGEANQLYAHDEALQYYRRALECAESLNLPERLAEIYAHIAWVYIDQGMLQQAIEALESALRLETDPRRRARLKVDIGSNRIHSLSAASADPDAFQHALEYLQAAMQELDPETQVNELALGEAVIGRYYHYHHETGQSIEHLRRALELAGPLDNPQTLSWIYGYLSGAYQMRGDFNESLEWAQRCIDLGQRKEYPLATALGYEFIAEDYFALGRWRESIEYSRNELQIAEKIGSFERMAWAENNLIYSLYWLGELAAALAAADRAVALAERIGDKRLPVLAYARRAKVLLDLDDDEAAQRDIDFVVGRARELNVEQCTDWAYDLLGYAYVQRSQWDSLFELAERYKKDLDQDHPELLVLAYLGLGRIREVNQLYEQYRDLDLTGYTPQDQAAHWRLVGQALAALGDWPEALRAFERALSGFEVLEACQEVARTLLARAETKWAMGDPPDACADLQKALQIFSDCGAKRGLSRAQALLEQWGCAKPQQRSS
jgi:predicted ATPase